MSWSEWLTAWLERIDIPVPKPMPEFQFAVGFATEDQFVLENAVDAAYLSLRLNTRGFDETTFAERLLRYADPQVKKAFPVRIGDDGHQYALVVIRLSFTEHRVDDLFVAFDQLWSLREGIMDLGAEYRHSVEPHIHF